MIPYTPEETLTLYLDGGYTKHAYKLMQAGAKSRNANLYPTYEALLKAKKLYYPNRIHVSDYSAHIHLQNMVNHIVTRIIESFSREFQFDFTEEQDQKITAIYKWGCEGSSGHSTYRQGFVNENNISDDTIHHQFHLTMIDGKVFRALANSSSQVCCICKASPKQMNNINLVQTITSRTHLYELGLNE